MNDQQDQQEDMIIDPLEDNINNNDVPLFNSLYQNHKTLIGSHNTEITEEIEDSKKENKELIKDIKNLDPSTNVIQYADNNGVMSINDYLELNEKIVSDDKLSAFYPFPNNDVPYSTWTLYKIARKIENLLDNSMIQTADSIYFAKNTGPLLDEKFYLSYVLRPYLVSLLKIKKEYREQVLKEKVSSFLSKYDYSGTLATAELNLHKNIEENNEARVEHEEATIKYLQKEKLKKNRKQQQNIPCAKICNFLLSNSNITQGYNDPYITIYNQFPQFYIQVLRKYDEHPKESDSDYIKQIEKEVENTGRSLRKNKDNIIQTYLCNILREPKTPMHYDFCSLIQKTIQNLLIEKDILLTHDEWLELFNHTPTNFQQEIAKKFIEYSQPQWTHFQLACPSDFTKLQPFLKHQKLCQYLFTPQSPMRGMLIWHTVGAGKTCLAIENLSYSWEGKYNILWITRKTLKNVPLENMFGKLKGNSAMDICHKRAREDFSNANSPIRKAYGNKPATEYPKLFTNYANWNAYSREKLKNDPKNFKSNNKSDYKNENNKDIRVLDYFIYGNTLLPGGSNTLNTTSKRMREWGMADQYTKGSDFLRKTVIGFDEAHNLFNPDLPKQEKKAIDKMLPQICQNIWHSYVVSKEDSCRVMLLTATPFTQADNPESFFKLINLMLPPKGYIELENNPNPLLYPDGRQYIGYFPVTLDQILEKYGFLVRDKNWIVANRKPSINWSLEETHFYYELLEKTKGLISYFDFSNNPNYFPLKIYTQPIGVPLKKLQCSKLFEKLKITDLTINEKFNMKCSKLLGKTPDECSRRFRCVNTNIESCNNENICKTPLNTNVTTPKPRNNDKKTKKHSATLLDEWYPNCPKTQPQSQSLDANLNEIVLGKKKEIPKTIAFPFETILQNEQLNNLSQDDLNYIRGLENGIFEIDKSINQEINNVNSFSNSPERNKELIKGMKELEQNCNKYEELFKQIDLQDREDYKNYGRLMKHVIYTDPNDFNKNQGIPWLCSAAFLYGYKMHSLTVRESNIDVESDSDDQNKPKKIKKVALVSVAPPNEKFYNTYNKDIYSPNRHKSNNNYKVLTLTSSILKGSMFFANSNLEKLYSKIPDGLKPEDKSEYESYKKNSYIQSVVSAFNSDSNIYGEEYRFLFIDSTFKEGISLRNARHYWLLDPPKSKSSLDQALGRVARLCNTDLPYGLHNRTTQTYEPGWQVIIHTLFSYIPMTGDILHSIITSQDKSNENLKLTQILISIAQLNSIDYILNSPTTNEETQYYELDSKYYLNKERKFGNHKSDQLGFLEYQKSNHNQTYRKRYINALNQICQDLNIP